MRPPTRRRLVFAIAVVVLVLPAIALGAVSGAAAPASNSASFTDSTGDTPQADISTVQISNDDTRMVEFSIAIPNRPEFGQDMEIDLFVDTDNTSSTGDQELVPGADYVIQLFRGEGALYKWDGSDFTRRFGDPSAVTLSTSYSGAKATFRISASELGNTKALRFLVIVFSGIQMDPTTGAPDYTNATADVAPNYGTGLYPFAVQVTPATLLVKRFSAIPARPAAGKPFTLRLVAARSDSGATVQNGRVTCIGRVGKARVTATLARVVAGAATCTWRIPQTATGKSFRGSVSVTFEGLKASQAYAGKIR